MNDKKMKIQTHTVYCEDYSEAAALQDLLQAADYELERSAARLEAGCIDIGSFTVNIGGRSIAFLSGAPQYEALIAFIEHLAGENLHAIDYDKRTVTGIL